MNPVVIISIPVFVLLIRLYLKYSLEMKNMDIIKNNNKTIENLKEKIIQYEDKLNLYLRETKTKSYEEFINNLTQYDKYKSYNDSMMLIIKNKEEEIKNYDIVEMIAMDLDL
jgi:hypothetical protein